MWVGVTSLIYFKTVYTMNGSETSKNRCPYNRRRQPVSRNGHYHKSLWSFELVVPLIFTLNDFTFSQLSNLRHMTNMYKYALVTICVILRPQSGT